MTDLINNQLKVTNIYLFAASKYWMQVWYLRIIKNK